jgi:glycerol-1-phosphate dehydrogenase [NAD(P)+]
MTMRVTPAYALGAPREIAVPVSLTVDEGAVRRVPDVVREVGLEALRLIVASGPGPSGTFAEAVRRTLEPVPERYVVHGNRGEDVVELDVHCAQRHVEGLVAVGGGRVIDVCKMVARQRGLPVLVVPTALSSDCISSPVAVIREAGHSSSLPAQMPVGVVIDLDVVRHCPRPVLLAGLGDLLSNLSASLDWQLAVDAGQDRWDGFADMLARQAAEQVLFLEPGRVLERDGLVRLAEGLVMSGIAMAIAGSSRPCSGSEHLISHALDELHMGHGSHGQQVALALLYVQALRAELGLPLVAQAAVRLVRAAGLPAVPQAIGVSREDFRRALEVAPATRPGRYTVLSGDVPAAVHQRAYERAYGVGSGE